MTLSSCSKMSVLVIVISFVAIIGSLMFVATIGGPILRFNDSRQVLSNNPC
jgi:hypothetical protein